MAAQTVPVSYFQYLFPIFRRKRKIIVDTYVIYNYGCKCFLNFVSQFPFINAVFRQNTNFR